jgi:hypothetical protein
MQASHCATGEMGISSGMIQTNSISRRDHGNPFVSAWAGLNRSGIPVGCFGTARSEFYGEFIP